jgi:hypothetical protein
MLRITTHNTRAVITFTLEGKLVGPWVRELELCWRDASAARRRQLFCVDLTKVNFIDSAGKNLLSLMHQSGAELIAAGCMTKALVESVVAGRGISSGLTR